VLVELVNVFPLLCKLSADGLEPNSSYQYGCFGDIAVDI